MQESLRKRWQEQCVGYWELAASNTGQPHGDMLNSFAKKAVAR
jgi:hypothetical protein